MSFFAPQFQIASDLHLETPVLTPQYTRFKLNVKADNLFLIGDIGLVVDDGLFGWMSSILEQNRGSRLFYVMGNHEPYRTTYEDAVNRLRKFEQNAKGEFAGRFKFLCRDRYDLNDTVTILGCTLWSAVQQHQEAEITSRMTDFNEDHGIRDWTLDRHRQEHEADLVWLNEQVHTMQHQEPQRQIVILTHHSPTTDPQACDPSHTGSGVSSAFATDLSKEACWQSPAVKLWAFGHTHYSCCFLDEPTGKLVVANQKGYSGLGAVGKRSAIKVRIVEARKGNWGLIEASNLVVTKEEIAAKRKEAVSTQENVSRGERKGVPTEAAETPAKLSRCVRLTQKIRKLF